MRMTARTSLHLQPDALALGLVVDPATGEALAVHACACLCCRRKEHPPAQSWSLVGWCQAGWLPQPGPLASANTYFKHFHQILSWLGPWALLELDPSVTLLVTSPSTPATTAGHTCAQQTVGSLQKLAWPGLKTQINPCSASVKALHVPLVECGGVMFHDHPLASGWVHNLSSLPRLMLLLLVCAGRIEQPLPPVLLARGNPTAACWPCWAAGCGCGCTG
jgi:hypothetical protein